MTNHAPIFLSQNRLTDLFTLSEICESFSQVNRVRATQTVMPGVCMFQVFLYLCTIKGKTVRTSSPSFKNSPGYNLSMRDSIPIYFMKHIPGICCSLILAFGAGLVSASAQSVNIVTALDSVDGVTITQPASLTQRLKRSENTSVSTNSTSSNVSAPASKSGYRIEIYADNNRAAKTEAANRKARVQARFPQYKVYQVFESPFWRVRLGDFRSRNEASEVLEELKRAFPSYSPFLRVVRDRIN